MSDYMHRERLRSHWLLADGTTIREPLIEQTPAGRRVRITGHSESVSRNDLGKLLIEWVTVQARKRETQPVYDLGGDPNEPDHQDLIIQRQVGQRFVGTSARLSCSTIEHFSPYATNSDIGKSGWLFKHPALPVYAQIELTVKVRGGTPYVDSDLTFAPMCRRDNRYYSFTNNQSTTWGGGELPIQAVPDHLRDAAREVLAGNGLPMGTESYPNGEAAMAEALRRYRAFDELSGIVIPDLFDSTRPSAGDHTGVISERRLKLLQPLQPESYLAEMVEFADSMAPASELLDLWSQMSDLLRSRGVVLPKGTIARVYAILHDSATSEPVKLRPYINGPGGIEEDRKHTVHLDLWGGVVHVACNERHHSKEEDVLAYEIAKERASITGETDLMEAFLSTITDHRKDEGVNKIVRAARHT